MTERKLRVAVVGGGVCGLACTIALLHEGVDVHVYEAAAQFGEMGAGIGVGRNAQRILTSLGVYDDIRARVAQENTKAAAQTTTNGAHTGDARGWFKYVSGMPGHNILADVESDEKTAEGVHRATFLDALVQHIDPARTHLSKRCTHLTHAPGEPVTIHFQDGSTATADVVLGADGIKSAVRRYTADTVAEESDPHVRFSRTRCYRTVIPVANAVAAGVQTDFRARPTCFVGENKHLIVFTIRGGTMINVVAFHADADSDPDHYPLASSEPVQKVVVEELLAMYDGWGPEVQNLLACAENPTKWTINVVYPPVPPEQWTRGPVAILGDAAHAMLPHLGAGAGQGLEDAYLLGKLLGHPQTTCENVADVLQAYAVVRQPRAQKVWEGSRRAGDIVELRTGFETFPFDELRETWRWIWGYPLDQAFEEAVALLVSNGAFSQSS